MGGAHFLYMSAIKDSRYPLNLGGKERHLLFSLNVLDEVQDKFGGYDKLNEIFDQDNKDWIKNTKWLLTLLINEGAEEGDEEVTERQVGRWIHTGNMLEVQKAIIAAFATGTSGDGQSSEENGENEGGNEGNTESGRA